MRTKRFACLSLALLTLYHPLLASAQPTQQLPWDWHAPWHMWSGGWGLWWICPMIMLFMIIVCAAMFFRGYDQAVARTVIGDRGSGWTDRLGRAVHGAIRPLRRCKS